MKLRALAAAPLIAATMLGTTAAAWPSATAATPQAPPALTTSALNARYQADAQDIEKAEHTAVHDGNTPLAAALKTLRTQHVLFFNPNGNGVAATVIGNLATATRVAILVPGSDTTLATFFSRGAASPGGGAEALADETKKLDPGQKNLAIIAWLGYPAPAMLSPSVMTSGDAGQGAQALKPLVTAIAKHGAQVALLCHSYGSVVCGLAAPNLPVTDIAVFGSPGMDANSAQDLHTAARVWAGREADDSIKYVPHVHLLGLGFGADPMSPGFGASIFATGDSGHSGYLAPGSESLRNLAEIALGHTKAVTR